MNQNIPKSLASVITNTPVLNIIEHQNNYCLYSFCYPLLVEYENITNKNIINKSTTSKNKTRKNNTNKYIINENITNKHTSHYITDEQINLPFLDITIENPNNTEYYERIKMSIVNYKKYQNICIFTLDGLIMDYVTMLNTTSLLHIKFLKRLKRYFVCIYLKWLIPEQNSYNLTHALEVYLGQIQILQTKYYKKYLIKH